MRRNLKISFECLTTPKYIAVYKSTVTDDFVIMDDGVEIGRFRKGDGMWFYYDGMLLRRFEKLSDLFTFVGETVEEQT